MDIICKTIVRQNLFLGRHISYNAVFLFILNAFIIFFLLCVITTLYLRYATIITNGNIIHKSLPCKYSYGSKMEGDSTKGESKRMAEFRKKIRETTPIQDLGEQPITHSSQQEDALPAWPDNTNPHTGEVGGPRGPEPTRYGDWERKGRVSDF